MRIRLTWIAWSLIGLLLAIDIGLRLQQRGVANPPVAPPAAITAVTPPTRSAQRVSRSGETQEDQPSAAGSIPVSQSNPRPMPAWTNSQGMVLRPEMQAYLNEKKKGMYMLAYENPDSRASAAASRSNLVTQAESQIEAAYTPLLSALGVAQPKVDRIEHHAAKILEAKLEANAIMGQLLQAQLSYDQEVKQSMSAEAYVEYRKYEEFSPGRDEFQRLTNTLGVNPADKEMIIRTMQELGTFSPSMGGPYQDALMPVADTEMVLRGRTEKRDALKAAVESVSKNSALSEEARRLLLIYYKKELNAAEVSLDRVIAPKPPIRSGG